MEIDYTSIIKEGFKSGAKQFFTSIFEQIDEQNTQLIKECLDFCEKILEEAQEILANIGSLGILGGKKFKKRVSNASGRLGVICTG